MIFIFIWFGLLDLISPVLRLRISINSYTPPTYKIGGTAEVTWSIRNNHGGGYQYRCVGWLGMWGVVMLLRSDMGTVPVPWLVPRSYHSVTTLVLPPLYHPCTVLPSGVLSIRCRVRLHREPRHAATPIYAYVGFARSLRATSPTSPRSVRELRHRLLPLLTHLSAL